MKYQRTTVKNISLALLGLIFFMVSIKLLNDFGIPVFSSKTILQDFDVVVACIILFYVILRFKYLLRATKKNDSNILVSNLIENLPGVAYRYKNDDDFSIDYISPGIFSLTGYSPKELIANHITSHKNLIHPDDKDIVLRKLKDSVDKQIRFDSIYRILHKKGHHVWVCDRGNCVYRDNRVIAIEGVIIDISEQKRLENAFNESKENFRALVDRFNIGVIRTTFNRHSSFLHTNTSMAKILGYESTDELTKINPHKLFANSDERKQFVRELLRKKQLQKHKLSLRNNHGEVCDLLFSGKLSYNTNGLPEKLVGIIESSDEKKSNLDDLLKREKLQSLGLIAGGVAHDFNNLLTGILCNIELVKMQIPETQTEIREILSEAGVATAQATKLSHQLLSFSKGDMPMSIPTCIKDLIIGSAKFSTRGSGIQCEYSIPDNLWPVNIDNGKISQVINNLIINAVQAMANKGSISITCKNVIVKQDDNIDLPPGRYVMTSILDQGKGIPQKIIDKIFDPYFTTKKTGSGLGLATCCSIIKEHKGLITVESKINAGTKFDIYLPAVQKKIKQTGVYKKTRLRKAQTEHLDGKILIMDDEEIIRKSIGSVIRTLGYSVSFATSGEEAIKMYTDAIDSGKPFDAVIMDLTVPGKIATQETLERLKQNDPSVKAIISSGYTNNPVMLEYKKHGFCGAINKPFEIEELFNTLKKVLSQN